MDKEMTGHNKINIFRTRFALPFGFFARKEWLRRLEAIIGALKEMNSSSEGEFLTIGAKLQDYYLRSRRISELSSSVAACMSGKEIEAAIEMLRNVLSRLEHLDGASRKGVKILTSIMGILEVLRRQVGVFEKIVRNLHILATFTRIESARVGDRAQGFTTLSEDIRNLAVVISDKSKKLLEQSFHMGFVIEQNLDMVRNFEARQQGETRQIIERTMVGLKVLTRRHGLSSATLEELAKRWEAVSESIGEVVASVQFHDITRQRIEHVCEALAGLEELMRGNRTGDGAAAQYPAHPGGNGGGSLGARQVATAAVSICELQAAQLESTRHELLEAVERILKSLRDISRNTTEMFQETKKVAGVKDREGRSFLEEMEKGFADLRSSLAHYARLNGDLNEAMNRIAETGSRMTDFLGDIEKIGIDMKMIALNACIHAAHIGSEGLALGVLADNIHQLSVDSANQIKIITANFNAVISDAGRLSQDAEGAEGASDMVDEQLAERIGTMVAPIHGLNGRIDDLQDDIDKEVQAFIAHMGSMDREITIHERMEEKIRQVNAVLAELVARLRSAYPRLASAEKKAALGGLEERYTMNRERDIHQTLLVGDGMTKTALPAGARAALPETPQAGEGGGDELGDNVELF